MNTVLVLLDIPTGFVPHAQYACGFFSDAWGLRVETTCDLSRRAAAHILYCAQEHELRLDGPITIPFDAALYELMTECRAADMGGRSVWCRAGAAPAAADLIAATFRLLTMAEEQQIRPVSRDSLGNFLIDALPPGRRTTIDMPLADHHASLLLEKLLQAAPQLRKHTVPRWPEGKKYAVGLSHDCDTMHPGHPREVAASAAKWLLRRKRVFLNMAVSGLKYRHSPMESPSWGFSGWRQYEEQHTVRSCFYLPPPPLACRRRLNDCKSDAFSAGIDWKVFQDLNGQGWEFGLHPVLNAKDNPEEFLLEKAALEERLGAPVEGLRHHYLAIDNLHPYRTFRKHAAAGFLYDASLGWQEKAGFRAGTALPFQPYDPELYAPLELIELPLTLMDTYVMNGDAARAVEAGVAIAGTVRDAGGAMMLNWHTETYCDRLLYRGYRTVLDSILQPLFTDRSAWFATPREIAMWWRSRRAALLPE
jgi:hypothetical protein